MQDNPPSRALPPREGWTLAEAAAELFPAAWGAAYFPADDMEARSRPGILPARDPLAGAPDDVRLRVTRAVWRFVHSPRAPERPLTDEDRAYLSAAHVYEIKVAENIAAARQVAADAARQLEKQFANRMARGDLIARGLDMAAGIAAAPVVIPAHVWGVAVPHFGLPGEVEPAGRVSGLPGDAVLHAVRIVAADSVASSGMADAGRLLRTPADLPAAMPLTMAIAWIATRDAFIAGRTSPNAPPFDPVNSAGRAVDWPLLALPSGEKIQHDLPRRRVNPFWLTYHDAAMRAAGFSVTLCGEDAAAHLLQWLRSGALVANAEWAATGERRDMLPAEWAFLSLDESRDNRDDVAPFIEHGGQDRRWQRVTVPRDALLALAPPHGAEPKPKAEQAQAEAKEAKLPDAEAAPSAANTEAVYSVKSLRAWYLLRVRTWTPAAPAPSENRDLADAKAYFGDAVTRQAIRDLSDLRPADWRKRGPRKGAGAINPQRPRQ